MVTIEIIGLKWSNIDRKAGFIRLPAESTKEKATNNVPINHNMKTVLNAIPRHINHCYVFTYLGKPLDKTTGNYFSFKKVCLKAGVPYGKKHLNGIV